MLALFRVSQTLKPFRNCGPIPRLEDEGCLRQRIVLKDKQLTSQIGV